MRRNATKRDETQLEHHYPWPRACGRAPKKRPKTGRLIQSDYISNFMQIARESSDSARDGETIGGNSREPDDADPPYAESMSLPAELTAASTKSRGVEEGEAAAEEEGGAGAGVATP